jgi:hypothetical protein
MPKLFSIVLGLSLIPMSTLAQHHMGSENYDQESVMEEQYLQEENMALPYEDEYELQRQEEEVRRAEEESWGNSGYPESMEWGHENPEDAPEYYE